MTTLLRDPNLYLTSIGGSKLFNRNKLVIPTGETMGFQPTQGDEKRGLNLSGYPQNCHPDRSAA
jgi:hypothetical protein